MKMFNGVARPALCFRLKAGRKQSAFKDINSLKECPRLGPLGGVYFYPTLDVRMSVPIPILLVSGIASVQASIIF